MMTHLPPQAGQQVTHPGGPPSLMSARPMPATSLRLIAPPLFWLMKSRRPDAV